LQPVSGIFLFFSKSFVDFLEIFRAVEGANPEIGLLFKFFA
jgi:hypothetical protein